MAKTSSSDRGRGFFWVFGFLAPPSGTHALGHSGLLVILAAASMEELAVVELPLAIPCGLHGSFVAA
jgi:carotenoid cleavage dioxygenase-like enzyme